MVQPSERTIDSLELRARILYDESNANESKIRRSADLERVRSRVLSDLLTLSRQNSEEETTTILLRRLNNEAKRYNVEVTSIIPVANARTTVVSESDLSGVDWTIGLRGRFRDVISLIADLPEHDVLLEVRDIQLTASSQETPGSPYLDASLSATVYRVASASYTEDIHAAGIAR